MKIIISEKPIAGKRIAGILSGNNFETLQDSGFSHFKWTTKGELNILIPLKGHINRVDFIDEDKYWNIYTLKALADKKFAYIGTERRIITELERERKDLTEIIIATDADREGEAIGLEAYNYVLKKNKNATLSRAYFSALTDKEVNDAFSKLRKLDFNYAYSVFTRQEIDLLWGAILTRYLSVVGNRKGKMFLSAGRVQTPLLNFIVMRELERRAFVPEKYNLLRIIFEKRKIKFEGIHKNGKMFDLDLSNKIYEKIKNAKIGLVKSIDKQEKKIPRPPPFNTTSFLRAASSLGIGTSQATSIAENLYQEGLISYPRTDNTVYPPSLDLKEILDKLKSNKIYKTYIDEITKKPLNPSRGDKETTDHPPIYPVGYSDKLSGTSQKIYELIVRRFLATLSKDAITENISAIIDVEKEPFSVSGQRILQAGWKEIYYYSKLNEVILPELIKGEEVNIDELLLDKKETTPPPQYSEGGLIKLMEEQNLGTKSTRPAIIQKLKDRNYIEGTKSISPTDIAIAVCSVLNKHCEKIVKPDLTAHTEIEMDQVAAGKRQQVEVVNETREIIKTIVDTLLKEKDAIASELKGGIHTSSFLGKCPACGKDLIIRYGGASGKQFVGCSGFPKCRTTYPLPQNKKAAPLNKSCPECNSPMVQMTGKRGLNFEMCLNPNCVTKEALRKEIEERKAAREEKAIAKEKKSKEKEEKAKESKKLEKQKKEITIIKENGKVKKPIKVKKIM